MLFLLHNTLVTPQVLFIFYFIFTPLFIILLLSERLYTGKKVYEVSVCGSLCDKRCMRMRRVTTKKWFLIALDNVICCYLVFLININIFGFIISSVLVLWVYICETLVPILIVLVVTNYFCSLRVYISFTFLWFFWPLWRFLSPLSYFLFQCF